MKVDGLYRIPTRRIVVTECNPDEGQFKMQRDTSYVFDTEAQQFAELEASLDFAEEKPKKRWRKKK